jgi:glyoxylase-like metal-dependent hydrolase (beta-lactamase superfamily II)
VQRVIAENPSKFTYHGTGTYIVGGDDVVVIDPGPVVDSHRDALHAALAGRTVRAVLITHCHSDHSPLAAWLAAETGAPTLGYGPHGDDEWDIGDDPIELRPPAPDPVAGGSDEAGAAVTVEESIDRAFTPDVVVRSGDQVAAGDRWTMRAVHTPGHTSNHVCYALDDGETSTLFTGDHVMGWSTTVVSPPDGDMTANIESLRVVAGRDDDLLIPTHGPPITQGSEFVGELLEHRLDRERQVLDAVRDGCGSVAEIVLRLYTDVDQRLHQPAGRSVLAHLAKLVEDDRVSVATDGRPRLDSVFIPV